MSTFRTLRPLVVDATQCEHGKTIATDTGFCNVSKGDWIVKGENGETYVVDDAFFQRTLRPCRPARGSYKQKRAVITAADCYIQGLPRFVPENIDHAYEDAAITRFFVRVCAGDERELSLFACSVRCPTLYKGAALTVPVHRPVVDIVRPSLHPAADFVGNQFGIQNHKVLERHLHSEMVRLFDLRFQVGQREEAQVAVAGRIRSITSRGICKRRSLTPFFGHLDHQVASPGLPVPAEYVQFSLLQHRAFVHGGVDRCCRQRRIHRCNVHQCLAFLFPWMCAWPGIGWAP